MRYKTTEGRHTNYFSRQGKEGTRENNPSREKADNAATNHGYNPNGGKQNFRRGNEGPIRF